MNEIKVYTYYTWNESIEKHGHVFTESQNDLGWKGTLKISLLRQVHLKQIAWVGFNYLQSGRLLIVVQFTVSPFSLPVLLLMSIFPNLLHEEVFSRCESKHQTSPICFSVPCVCCFDALLQLSKGGVLFRSQFLPSPDWSWNMWNSKGGCWGKPFQDKKNPSSTFVLLGLSNGIWHNIIEQEAVALQTYDG